MCDVQGMIYDSRCTIYQSDGKLVQGVASRESTLDEFISSCVGPYGRLCHPCSYRCLHSIVVHDIVDPCCRVYGYMQALAKRLFDGCDGCDAANRLSPKSWAFTGHDQKGAPQSAQSTFKHIEGRGPSLPTCACVSGHAWLLSQSNDERRDAATQQAHTQEVFPAAGGSIACAPMRPHSG